MTGRGLVCNAGCTQSRADNRPLCGYPMISARRAMRVSWVKGLRSTATSP